MTGRKPPGMRLIFVASVLAVLQFCSASELVFRVASSIGQGSACSSLYDDVAAGYAFFYNHLSQQPPLEVVDADGLTHTLRFAYTHMPHNCSEEGRAAAMDTLLSAGTGATGALSQPSLPGGKVHFLLGGLGDNAAGDSLQSNDTGRLLLHCCVARDSVYRLGLPHVYGVLTPATQQSETVLRTMAFGGVQRLAVVYNRDRAFYQDLCEHALSYMDNLQKLRPQFGVGLVLNYSAADADTPGFSVWAAGQIAGASVDALFLCDSTPAMGGLVARLRAQVPGAAAALKAVWLATNGGEAELLTWTSSGLEYALTTLQWDRTLPYADSFFGSAASFSDAFAAATGHKAAAAYSAAAAVTGRVLQLAVQGAVSMCSLKNVTHIAPDGRAVVDMDEFMWRPAGLSCFYNLRRDGMVPTRGYDTVRYMTDMMSEDTMFGPIRFDASRQNIAHRPVVAQVLGHHLAVVLPLDVSTQSLVLPIPGPQPADPWATTPAGIAIITLACCLAAACLAVVALLAYGWHRRRKRTCGIAEAVIIKYEDLQVDAPPCLCPDGLSWEAGEGVYRGARVKLVVAAEMIPQQANTATGAGTATGTFPGPLPSGSQLMLPPLLSMGGGSFAGLSGAGSGGGGGRGATGNNKRLFELLPLHEMRATMGRNGFVFMRPSLDSANDHTAPRFLPGNAGAATHSGIMQHGVARQHMAMLPSPRAPMPPVLPPPLSHHHHHQQCDATANAAGAVLMSTGTGTQDMQLVSDASSRRQLSVLHHNAAVSGVTRAAGPPSASGTSAAVAAGRGDRDAQASSAALTRRPTGVCGTAFSEQRASSQDITCETTLEVLGPARDAALEPNGGGGSGHVDVTAADGGAAPGSTPPGQSWLAAPVRAVLQRLGQRALSHKSLLQPHLKSQMSVPAPGAVSVVSGEGEQGGSGALELGSERPFSSPAEMLPCKQLQQQGQSAGSGDLIADAIGVPIPSAPALTQTPQRRQKYFADLAFRAVRLQHRNICPIVGVVPAWPGVTAPDGGPLPVVVRQWYEFSSLADLLDNETVALPMTTRMQIATGVAEGLAYLHAQVPAIIAGSVDMRRILIDKGFSPHIYPLLTSLDPAYAQQQAQLQAASASSRRTLHGPNPSDAVLDTTQPDDTQGLGACAPACLSSWRQCLAAKSPAVQPQELQQEQPQQALPSAPPQQQLQQQAAAPAPPRQLPAPRPSHAQLLLQLAPQAYAPSLAQDVFDLGRLLWYLFTHTPGGHNSSSGELSMFRSCAFESYPTYLTQPGLPAPVQAHAQPPASAPSKAHAHAVAASPLAASGPKVLSSCGNLPFSQPDASLPGYASSAGGAGLSTQALMPALASAQQAGSRKGLGGAGQIGAEQLAAMLESLVDICPALAALVEACLHPQPDRRPTMAEAVARLTGEVQQSLLPGSHWPHAQRLHAQDAQHGEHDHHHHSHWLSGGDPQAGHGCSSGPLPQPGTGAEAATAEDESQKDGSEEEHGSAQQRGSGPLRLARGKRSGSPGEREAARRARRNSTAVALGVRLARRASLLHAQGLLIKGGEQMRMLKHQLAAADDLLFDVFPPRVARALQAGEGVEPERYDCVSIFFSDIVGYTDICAQLMPWEIAQLLDRLYSQFDAMIMEQGLFKVETIGDAYMAVGNLRSPQPHSHALLLARFAFDAVRAATSVPVHPDRPELGHLHIRVGLHAGPVVASVVGLINRRYCLFGDTVNTASRMESNSARDRVHCSAPFAQLLREQGAARAGLVPVARGLLQVKGKGAMHTYWVEEREAQGGGQEEPQEGRGSRAEGQGNTGGSVHGRPAEEGQQQQMLRHRTSPTGRQQGTAAH